MNDAIENLEPADRARSATLATTLAVVRRRRLARRAAALVVVACAYGAGFATSAGIGGFRSEPAPRIEPAPPPAAPPTARELESQALAASSFEKRANLLKEAGDRYLSELGDVEAALSCYRELLRLAPSIHLPRSDAPDTWLWAALKRGSD
jgi:hypothetical protein